MTQRKVNSGSFKNAFNTARNQGKGLFTWNGKQYNTMKKGENADTFRQQYSDYDQFLGNVASSQGGWHVQNPIDTSYIINKVPKPVTEKSNGVSPSNQVQQNTQLQMFTNDDIRSLGFRNYNGLVSAVGNQANTNNNFVKAMVNRYGSDTSKWNQNTIENDLGVSGTYRSFGRGDFGDMSRSMASWLGTYNGNLAKQEQERIWNQNAGVKYSLNDNSVLANKYQLSKPSISNNLVNLKFKQGGQMYKYAAGAQMIQPQQASEQQGMEQQAIALVQAAMQGDQQANQTIQKIMQAAQQGDQQAAQVAKLLQAIVQQMRGSRKARLGAKLDYIKQSIGECPEGQEVVYFKKGGEICKICAGKKMQDGGKSDPIKEFKKKKVNKHQQGGWINRDKKIWNWDSADRFNRVKAYYQGKAELSDDDWEYVHGNPELESALHNLYKVSQIPNHRTVVSENNQGNTNNMPKGADPNARIITVPDSTNNFKGSLGVGQFKMLSSQSRQQKPKVIPSQSRQPKKPLTQMQANTRRSHFHNWQAVARNKGYAPGTFMPYMHSQGFAYNQDQGVWYNPKTGLYLYAGPNGTVTQRKGQYRVPYNGIKINWN